MARNTQTSTSNHRWAGVLTLALVVVATIGTATALADNPATAGVEVVTQYPGKPFTAEEAEAVAASQRLYEAWGLQFPDAVIRFHADSNGACKGEAGLYKPWPQGPATVDVCYSVDDPEIGHILRARVLWHEMAHAYVEPRADEATKASFLDRVGLRAWMGESWGERGSEYAAEILVWGMMGGRHTLMLGDMDCETKAAGFSILTGLKGPTC